MRLAEKLLEKHNLRQADVLCEDHVPEALRGGKAVVHLRSPKDLKPCTTKQWMHTLGRACTTNFECAYYFSSHTGQLIGDCRLGAICDFTFYGIATNASLAAFAFAAAFNRIAILSCVHAVPVDEYERKRRRGEIACSKGAYTAAARESYRDGLARGLLDEVRAAKKSKDIALQQRLEMARAKASTGEAWMESDDDDDDDVGCVEGGSGRHSDDGDNRDRMKLQCDADIKLHAGGEGGGASSAVTDGGRAALTAAEAVVRMERDQKTALTLTAHTEKVAETFLKEVGVKLSHRKHAYTKCAWRAASYEQGKEDSKNIDINQRAIK